MIKSTLVAAVAAAGTFSLIASAHAGLDGLHKQAKVGNLVCMIGHEHRGQSGLWATEEQAEKAAIRSWVDFTAAEYGRHWGMWKLAADKGIDCSSSMTSRGKMYSCKTIARPCRPASAGQMRHHRR